MSRGAELYVIVHRSLLDAGTKDLTRQALASGVPNVPDCRRRGDAQAIQRGGREAGLRVSVPFPWTRAPHPCPISARETRAWSPSARSAPR
jgi:hypothetical protein